MAELETELDEIAATMLGRSSANVAQRTALAAGVRSAALVVPHVAGAIERAIELGVDCVHYLSREGASLARLHEQVAEVLFGRWAPRAVHLEVSRRSTFGPSLRSLDDESLQRMWRQYADQSPVGLIASLGLEPASFRERLATAGLDPDTVIPDIAGDRRIRSFLQTPDVARTMRCALDEQRGLLVRYLSDRGLGGERHVVVDVGWRGTIQDNLCHLLPHTELHGVYFGLFPYLNPQPANSTKRAVVFDGNLGERYDMVNPPAAIEAPLTPPIAERRPVRRRTPAASNRLASPNTGEPRISCWRSRRDSTSALLRRPAATGRGERRRRCSGTGSKRRSSATTRSRPPEPQTSGSSPPTTTRSVRSTSRRTASTDPA